MEKKKILRRRHCLPQRGLRCQLSNSFPNTLQLCQLQTLHGVSHCLDVLSGRFIVWVHGLGIFQVAVKLIILPEQLHPPNTLANRIGYATYLVLIGHCEKILSGCQSILNERKILLYCQTHLARKGQETFQSCTHALQQCYTDLICKVIALWEEVQIWVIWLSIFCQIKRDFVH